MICYSSASMSKTTVQKTIDYVRSRFLKEGSGHDWQHTRRVWETAKFLQSKEGGNLELIEIAALLHCAAEHDIKHPATDKMRMLTMRGIMDVLEIEEEMQEKIITIAQQCRFKGVDTDKPDTIEGKVVQDANWLEVLGAIGIARIFTAGGYLGRTIYDPDKDPKIKASKDVFQKRRREGTSFNYFYEKAFQVVDFISTPTAKAIAEKRLRFTKEYLKQFLVEWNQEDFK